MSFNPIVRTRRISVLLSPARLVPLLMLAVCCFAPKAFAADSAELPAIWRTALAQPVDLNIEWGETFVHDGVSMRRLHYTGSLFNGKPQRIAAIYGQPEGAGPFPAILQVHGGGQTANPDNVAWFVRHGYACLAYDWGGGPHPTRPDNEVTLWDPLIRGGGYWGKSAMQLEASTVFQGVLAGVRGIDVLQAQPQVKPDRIGIQGISWGGFLTWILNAVDSRARAVAPTYGVGDIGLHWGKIADGLRHFSPEHQAAWTAQIDPVSLIAQQHAPVLFVSASDDFFGPQDIAEKRLAAISVPHRRTYSPNTMHSLDPPSVATAMAWFDAFLKGDGAVPAEPVLHLEVDAERRLTAIVTADPAAQRVDIDFARGERHPILRCWLTVPATRGADGLWRAPLPLVDATEPLSVTAQAISPDGARWSSAVAHCIPAVDFAPRPLAEAPSDAAICDWGHATGGWYIHRGTDFFQASTPDATLVPATVEGREALLYASAEPARDVNLSMRLPADSAVQKGNRRSLEVWVHDVASLRLRTNYFLRELDSVQYLGVAQGGPGWQRIVFDPASMTAYGNSAPAHAEDRSVASSDTLTGLASWNEVHQFNFVARVTDQGQVAFGRIAWIDPPASH